MNKYIILIVFVVGSEQSHDLRSLTILKSEQFKVVFRTQLFILHRQTIYMLFDIKTT